MSNEGAQHVSSSPGGHHRHHEDGRWSLLLFDKIFSFFMLWFIYNFVHTPPLANYNGMLVCGGLHFPAVGIFLVQAGLKLAKAFGSTISMSCGSNFSKALISSMVTFLNPEEAVMRRRPDGELLLLRSTYNTDAGLVGRMSFFFLRARFVVSLTTGIAAMAAASAEVTVLSWAATF